MDDFDNAAQRVIASIPADFQDQVRTDIAALRDRGVDSWPDLARALGAFDTTPGAVPGLITALRTDADRRPSRP